VCARACGCSARETETVLGCECVLYVSEMKNASVNVGAFERKSVCVCVYVYVCVYVCVCVCMCVCMYVFVLVCEKLTTCVIMNVREKEREGVCVSDKERKR
jgi:hypothetical protein